MITFLIRSDLGLEEFLSLSIEDLWIANFRPQRVIIPYLQIMCHQNDHRETTGTEKEHAFGMSPWLVTGLVLWLVAGLATWMVP